jgi:putative hydrolase of the HAD superfamily
VRHRQAQPGFAACGQGLTVASALFPQPHDSQTLQLSLLMNSNIKVIFFDVGNTLLFPNRERIHAPLAERGIVPDAEHLRDLECRTKNQFDGMMTGTTTKTGSADHGFWWMFYSQLLSEIGLEDDAIRDQLVTSIRQSGNWDRIRPGTAEQLREIGECYRIAVISNADGGIKDVLHRCGIAGCFLTITDSGHVGYEKPHPEIFRQALKSMNAAPEQSLYVGDVYSVDYLGATGAGMQAVLMDVPGAYRDKGVPRVESLKELQIALRDLP